MDLILLFFLSRLNSKLASKKGLNGNAWQLYTILAWVLAEVIGIFFALSLFRLNPKYDILTIAIFALTWAFGGYLGIRFILEKKPLSPTH